MAITDRINAMTERLNGTPSGGSIDDCLDAYFEAVEASGQSGTDGGVPITKEEIDAIVGN